MKYVLRYESFVDYNKEKGGKAIGVRSPSCTERV